MMEREKLFEEFLKACEEKKHICGQGNPNADILIIGKESTDTSEELIRKIHRDRNFHTFLSTQYIPSKCHGNSK